MVFMDTPHTQQLDLEAPLDHLVEGTSGPSNPHLVAPMVEVPLACPQAATTQAALLVFPHLEVVAMVVAVVVVAPLVVAPLVAVAAVMDQVVVAVEALPVVVAVVVPLVEATQCSLLHQAPGTNHGW